MYEFKLPDIGEGLHEAELLAWDVEVGDTVGEGDSIAQVSTDKVNVELPSPRAGVIAELPWQPGDVIPVGEVLARIDDGKGEEVGSDEDEPGAKPEKPGSPGPRNRERVVAAPAVRRYAAEQGVDLAQVPAAGAAVTREDVDAFLAGDEAPGDEQAQSGATRIKLSGPRLAAAKRLEQSWRTLATSAMTFEVRGDGLLAATRKLAGESDGRVSPLAVIAACVCEALAAHPQFNATIDDDARALDVMDEINLGIAVDGPDGLLVPVVKDAGEMSAGDLAAAIASRAEKARSGHLAVADFQGSTFTISSTGSLEQATIVSTTPVINYPNVATLWISRISDRPRVRDGALEAGPVMSATLAFDHRFLHGADATRFINTLAELFESAG